MADSIAAARSSRGQASPRAGAKWIRLALIFTASLILGDRAIGFGIRTLSEGAYRKTVRGIRQIDGRLDILFLGSSHTYSGVRPEDMDRLGLRTYALALPAAGPEIYRVALDSFLRTNPPPRLIAVECSYLTVTALTDPSMDRMLPEFDWPARWAAWRDSGRVIPPPGLLSEVARFHRDLTPALRNGLRLRRPWSEWDRGFIPTRGSLAPGDAEALKHLIVPMGDQLLPRKMKDFEALLVRIAELGIPCLVFEVPEYADALGPSYQPRRAEFRSWLESAARSEGFGFISYNDLLTPDCLNRRAELYRNGDHLNADGAAVFSPILGADLMRFLERGA